MRAIAWVFLLAATFLAAPASADDRAGASDDSFYVDSAEEVQSERSPDGQVKHGPSPSSPAFILGTTGCAAADGVADAAAGGLSDVSFCAGEETPAPVVTLGAIRRAFAELKLPAGEMVVQPPDGLTLVNFDTNFYTTTIEPITRTVRLLGRQVTLEATPSRYTWTFSDGQSLTTTDPGAPYPRLTITHNYLRTGTYRPALATTYTGRFRVGNGPWRQIPGTVTIDGTGQPLRAIEAEPKLVSY